ncbi:MAG: SUF system NifU family Fe-S cluster assembly protein [Xanthomonadales bacterium]|nr:SUF system NifU family Fe-S cluster assembly protein [Xanthomonadales bacterium]
MSIQDLYRAAVIDHNRDPRNFEEMADATHRSRGLNALCGDDIRVYLRVSGERIERVSFIGQASAITMASASMMTERVASMTTAEAREMHQELKTLLTGDRVPDSARQRLGDLAALEGVRQYPSRIKSATLPWQTLVAALDGDDVASTE